jgi:hypothetical protein
VKQVVTAVLAALAVFSAVQTAAAAFGTEQTATAAPNEHFPMYSEKS